MLSSALLVFTLARVPAQEPAEAPAVKARSHLLVAEAVRVDLRRRVLVVKTGDTPPAELEIGVEEGRTRITSGGRATRFEEIRAGDRVAVSCSDDAADAHLARLIVIRSGRAGGSRPGSPSPSPSPSPTPPPAAF